MNTENLSTLKIHKLTKEQYNRELAAGRIDESALYLTPNEDVDLSGYATNEQLDTKADKVHTHNSYVNQNAFSNVAIGTTTIAADSATDTLTLVAGSNVTITPDATNDKITISATDTVYAHPSYTARTGKPTANQTPAFGGTATVSQITSDATGHVTNMTDRTITIPSTLSNGAGTAGLIKTSSTVTSSSGYTACPVISGVPYYKDTNTTYTLPAATTSDLGGVKVGSNITVSSGTISLTKSNVTTALGYTPAPSIIAQTTDPGAGSTLATGTLLCVYE